MINFYRFEYYHNGRYQSVILDEILKDSPVTRYYSPMNLQEETVMATSEHMILAKNIEAKKIPKYAAMSEKIDGVPGIFGRSKIAMSRQGKPITSVQHIEHTIDKIVPRDIQIIGELHIPGAPFKYSSGKVRKNEQSPDIHLGIWDVVLLNKPDAVYMERIHYLDSILDDLFDVSLGKIDKIPMQNAWFDDYDDAMNKIKAYYETLRTPFKRRVIEFAPETPLSGVGEPEGVIIRDLYDVYRTGRSWGFQRYVVKPTIDLRVCALAEATANKRMEFLGDTFEKGEGLRAIGALWVNFKGTLVKVGPGAMTHKERRLFWLTPELIHGKIIKVQYKTDPTYDALREPTYVEIRDDKTIADTEELLI